MPSTNALLDKVKEVCSIPSDNALSQRIGVTRALISGWRNARYPIPDERIAYLCAMAKLDAGEWVARIHSEAAASPTEKAMWRSVLDRLSAAAAVVALVVLTIGTVPAMSRANHLRIQEVVRTELAYSVYYVKMQTLPQSAELRLGKIRTRLAQP